MEAWAGAGGEKGEKRLRDRRVVQEKHRAVRQGGRAIKREREGGERIERENRETDSDGVGAS